jgi:hypothetical protein
MVTLNQILNSSLVLGFAWLISTVIFERNNLEDFVPYNSFEIPKSLQPKEWQTLHDKFGTLIQLINATEFSVAFQMNDMITAFKAILNSMGTGKYELLSVEDSTPLSLTNVMIQDVETLAVMKFSRVDFIVETTNPFVINKVIVTPDQEFNSSQKILPKEPLSPQKFRIRNPLHLFHPYYTSDEDMKMTPGDKLLFDTTVREKSNELQTMASQNAVLTGNTVILPASSLPSADQVSKNIVGAGPLHFVNV